MKKYCLFIIVALFCKLNFFAQELNCQVKINYTQLQGTANKQIFEQLEKAIFEFMNNKKWTKEIYTTNERIDCSVFINIKEAIGADDFSASIQVQSRRPIYKTSIFTQMFNFEDDDFVFKFQQFSQLEFNETTFQNNLTSVLAFYAYVILAEDADSFSLLGGTEHWQKAQLIVNNAQTAAEKGWRNSEGNRNRYWIVENQLQPVFKGIRECHYEYCRNGLDIMFEKTDEGRANILKSLDLLKPVYQARPASFNMQLFFNAKKDELINIFKGGLPEEKNTSVETLMLLDPANTTRYLKIQEGK
ncbi:MAG: DUF4835 family protein [Bacteroidetes bacterium]|nr:DUF4835 family protein [Bacteroidota bacterium]